MLYHAPQHVDDQLNLLKKPSDCRAVPNQDGYLPITLQGTNICSWHILVTMHHVNSIIVASSESGPDENGTRGPEGLLLRYRFVENGF